MHGRHRLPVAVLLLVLATAAGVAAQCDPLGAYSEFYDELEETLICLCNPGWTGPTCAIAPAGCGAELVPCNNHGTCFTNGTCACTTPWSGIACNITDCGVDQLCGGPARGACSLTTGRCTCVGAYWGVYCGNSPTCNAANAVSANQTTGVCTCNANYVGILCSCNATNTISTSPTTGLCTACRQPYYGSGTCASVSACASAGTLSISISSGACTCRSGWIGTRCNCFNAGTANATTTSCTCNAGYGGVGCSETLNQCGLPSDPCNGRGECTASGCVCYTTAYGGQYCEVPTTCNVNRTLFYNSSSSTCECVEGAVGTNCSRYAGWLSDTYCAPGSVGCAYSCSPEPGVSLVSERCSGRGECCALNPGFCPGWTSTDPPCECVDGWGGITCSVPQCKSFGTADDLQWEVCNCLPGYSGELCGCFQGRDASTDASLQMCAGRGVCVAYMVGHTTTCECSSGYGGDHCCVAACGNNGKCLLDNSTRVPYCECNSGYTGASCETYVGCSTACGIGDCEYTNEMWGADQYLGYYGDNNHFYRDLSTAFTGVYIEGSGATTAYNTIYYFVTGPFQIELARRYGNATMMRQLVMRGLAFFAFEQSLNPYEPYIQVVVDLLLTTSTENRVRAIYMVVAYGIRIDTTLVPPRPVPLLTSAPYAQCVCPVFATGPVCTEACPLSEINNRPCTGNHQGEFHGVCRVSTGECVCNSRYAGEACDTYIGEGCFATPNNTQVCSAHGTCEYGARPGGEQGYVCACDLGYGGSFCEQCDPGWFRCPNNGRCAEVACECNAEAFLELSNTASNVPVLPVGTLCNVDAAAWCATYVSSSFVSGTVTWGTCSGHGMCVDATPHPFCNCTEAYNGTKCESSVCQPVCTVNQTCTVAMGACRCLPLYTEASGCAMHKCVHGRPDSTGENCICDPYWTKSISTGFCTVVQCPLVTIGDTGERVCNSTNTTTPLCTGLHDPHTDRCCKDVCVGRCSFVGASAIPTCSCDPTAAYQPVANQTDGVCHSKCNGHSYTVVGASVVCTCSSGYFLERPWNATVDIMSATCLRQTCLNGGVATSLNTRCSCPTGYLGNLCQNATAVSSSSSSSSSTGGPPSSTGTGTLSSTGGVGSSSTGAPPSSSTGISGSSATSTHSSSSGGGGSSSTDSTGADGAVSSTGLNGTSSSSSSTATANSTEVQVEYTQVEGAVRVLGIVVTSAAAGVAVAALAAVVYVAVAPAAASAAAAAASASAASAVASPIALL